MEWDLAPWVTVLPRLVRQPEWTRGSIAENPKSENRKIKIQHSSSFYFLLYNNIYNNFMILKYKLLNNILLLEKISTLL